MYNTFMHRSAVIQLNSHTNNERCRRRRHRWSMTIALCYAISTHNVLTIITKCYRLIQETSCAIGQSDTKYPRILFKTSFSWYVLIISNQNHVFIFHQFPLCCCCKPLQHKYMQRVLATLA